MQLDFKNHKILFDYIRKYDLNDAISLRDILSRYKFETIEIEQILNDIAVRDDILLIDARSEKEYEESTIPKAINFPILKTKERRNVGLVYKKYSPVAAIKLAMEYADFKLNDLNNFLNENNASGKQIYVFCWRGGGRSAYLASKIIESGYIPVILKGGEKSYRKKVIEFFTNEFEYDLIELSGMTGTGKTEILNNLKNVIPVIDLELAAKHCSSLFGRIPYNLKNMNPVSDQKSFENNIFSQIILSRIHLKKFNSFLIESESKKIGDFFIPKSLFEKIQTAQSIKVICSLESRINRIVKQYFSDLQKGTEEVLKVFSEKEKFFRKEMSNKYYEEALSNVKSGDVFNFTKILLLYYYDIKYRDKGKKPVLTVNSDNIELSLSEIVNYFSKNK